MAFAAAQSAHVIEVNEANFQTEVVARSATVPIVIDFWASWCGPCKTLGPVLEQLAEEYKGAFRLAKVDVDKNPNLAMAFGVQSIPLVVAVKNGGVANHFVGSLPKAEVKRFIETVVGKPAPGKAEPKPPANPAQARALYTQRLEKNDKDDEALLELARLHVNAGEVDKARERLQKIEPSMERYNAAQALLKLLGLLSEVAEAGGEDKVRQEHEQNPGDARTAYLAALADAGRGRYAAAVEQLVSLVASSPADVKEAAKKAAGPIFEAAGRNDPQVEAQRKRLATLLY